MEILQGVPNAEAGTQVQMQLGVTDRRKIHQNRVAVGLLQRQRRIHGGRGRSRSPFGAKECENSRLSGSAPGARTVGTESRQGF